MRHTGWCSSARVVLLQALIAITMVALSSPAHAGRNANGALIVHTNDAVTYTGTADYCSTSFLPASCEAAVTRTDKDENTPAVIWLLAAFPDTSSPAVTTIQFGIEHNLPANEGYFEAHGKCSDLELPDAGWPETGFGNLVSFGSMAKTDLLFCYYWFAVYGFEDAYFSTTTYPSTDEAKFVDDSAPPVEDLVTKFGTVRWYEEGQNECPSGGGDTNGGINGGEADTPEEPGDDTENNEWLDGDGRSQWVANCILARLSSDLPTPPRDPADTLGIASFDSLGRELGVVNVKRLLMLNDEACKEYPIGSHLVKITLATGADEEDIARQFRQLPGVVWAIPDYVFPGNVLSDPYFNMQWYLGPPSPTSCMPDPPDPAPECCEECDIGVVGAEGAWSLTRGNPHVIIAFLDAGADMQHPDLYNSYAMNPGEDDGDGIAELCPVAQGGDIGDLDNQGGPDDDDNGIADDVLLGWNMGFGQFYEWKHPPYSVHDGPHGTMVAGILGGITNNSFGIASVAGGDPETSGPGVKLIQFSFNDHIFTSAEINSFYYAKHYGATVYSSSAVLLTNSTCCFGDGNCEVIYLEEECIAEGGTWVGVPDVIQAPELASAMLFVQAAGNNGTTPLECGFARLPGVMAVGGYDCKTGGRWVVPEGHGAGLEGSSYGPELSVMGPADDPLDDVYGNGYERMVMASTSNVTAGNYSCVPATSDAADCFGGTSAAAPVVASVAALVLSYLNEHGAMPPVNIPQLRKILEHTAEDILCDPRLTGCNCSNPSRCVSLLGWDQYSGYGRVDAKRALTLPVAILAPLELPHDGYVIHGETIHLTWEAFDINYANGNMGTGARFELHYLVPEDGLDNGWVLIDNAISPEATYYDWVVPNTVATGPARRVRLTIVDSGGHGNQDYSERFWVVSSVASVSAVSGPSQGDLHVSPNPTSFGAKVLYSTETSGVITAGVYDVAGRHVRTLARGRFVGSQAWEWDGLNDLGYQVESGIYFVRVDCGSQQRSVRVVRLR